MMAVAAAFGGLSCVAGLYLSYHVNLASGGLIVIIVSTIFLACWLLAPKHGFLARRRIVTRWPLHAVAADGAAEMDRNA
jgi:manganese/iron transport system permease protein